VKGSPGLAGFLLGNEVFNAGKLGVNFIDMV
jgi:hypothetical protein